MDTDKITVHKGDIDVLAARFDPYWPDIFNNEAGPCIGCDDVGVLCFNVETWDFRIEGRPHRIKGVWCFDCLSRQVKAVKESEIAGTILDFSE